MLPPRVNLTPPVSFQRLVVEARVGEQFVGEVTGKATFQSSNPKVASVSKDGLVVGRANGTATITALVGLKTAAAAVVVHIRPGKSDHRDSSWSFRSHVLAVLTKAGCNSGACHGASGGKGGLKLTLRGYDPQADYYTLTRQALARRIDRVQPAGSLMLLKPTATIPHGGGLRLAPGSLEYRVILDWIQGGLKPPQDSDPKVERLEVLPAQVALRKGDLQQIVVRAHFSDGHTEDVTRWIKFSTADSTIATVDDSGRVTVTGSGETAITVWYASKVAFAMVTVPFGVADGSRATMSPPPPPAEWGGRKSG